MIATLSITVLILSVTIVFLFLYILNQIKSSKNIDKNNPEYLKLQNELDKQIDKTDLVENYIKELKKDKEQLISNKNDVDTFKEISNRSFSEYKSVISEYKNFHEKLVGDVKYQGKFNERTLRNILERHGLKEEDGDFDVGKEKKISDPETGEEKIIKPDFILNLQDNQKIVIDCKVSLKNFEDFVNSKDKDMREENLNKHIESVKKHITDLGFKNYSKLYQLENMQYVVMFMPFDACYLSVLEKENSSLLDLCYEKKILLAGPISIMSLIATATSIKNEKKNKSLVSKIVKEATAIYDKYTFLKKNLKKTIDSHKAHTNSLKQVINAAYGSNQSLEDKLVKLKKTGGLGQTKELPNTTENDVNLDYVEDPEKPKIVNIKE